MWWPQPCPPQPCPQYLPITTGRAGVSQTTGDVEFYGHNYRGTGMGLFYGRCVQWQTLPQPGGCCGSGFSTALAAVLTGGCAPSPCPPYPPFPWWTVPPYPCAPYPPWPGYPCPPPGCPPVVNPN